MLLVGTFPLFRLRSPVHEVNAETLPFLAYSYPENYSR